MAQTTSGGVPVADGVGCCGGKLSKEAQVRQELERRKQEKKQLKKEMRELEIQKLRLEFENDQYEKKLKELEANLESERDKSLLASVCDTVKKAAQKFVPNI
ncbi:hypothetical protein BaRGS_00017631 [Batillaria attramentaria]|uniref:Uncharacterized protein n=1 Tax=Batillaria attramentaria TaxID=370345 RepID=A0ABD0KVN4_9CAEN